MAIDREHNTGKIIGVGFQKTGTSTLREALKILGYRVCDTKPNLLVPILKENYRKVFRKLDQYDAAEDNPWPMLFKEIDRKYPGSKFILTVRDTESWYKSVSRHIGNLRAPIHEWIYGKGKGLPKDDKQHTISIYKKHNQAVMSYFENRPENLLVLDFNKGDGWEELCAFLGHEIPSTPLPHYNDASKHKKKNLFEKVRRFFKVQKKRAKYFFIMLYIRWFTNWDGTPTVDGYH